MDKASEHTDIQPDLLDYFKKPDNLVKFTLPLVRDDNTIEMIPAYRCQHKIHRTPTKGGLRFADTVTIEQM